MTVINRQPSGLSDFLQVQAGGKQPDDISQTLRGVIDVECMYAPDRLRAAIEPFNMTPGQLEFVEVPEGQVWKVYGVGYEQTNATTNGNNGLSVWQERIPGQGLNGVPWIDFFLGSNLPQTNVSRFVRAVELAQPRVITSGQRVVISYDHGDSANVIGNFYVTYVLLQA